MTGCSSDTKSIVLETFCQDLLFSLKSQLNTFGYLGLESVATGTSWCGLHADNAGKLGFRESESNLGEGKTN